MRQVWKAMAMFAWGAGVITKVDSFSQTTTHRQRRSASRPLSLLQHHRRLGYPHDGDQIYREEYLVEGKPSV
ncbi:MAG: hypothetical protein M3Z35_03565 [Nitrospirota bacterium]|nr:hypothetical protein [Nitrospirota bacterium]